MVYDKALKHSRSAVEREDGTTCGCHSLNFIHTHNKVMPDSLKGVAHTIVRLPMVWRVVFVLLLVI